MSATQVADIIVPDIFGPYAQRETEEKSRLIESGALVRSPALDVFLAGGGETFKPPSFDDLDASDATGIENVSNDAIADVQTLASGAGTTLAAQQDARPQKTTALNELARRLARNQSWSSASLTAQLAGADPQASIVSRVSKYWARRLQRVFVQTINGVFADNAAAPTGGDQHLIDDMTEDVTGTFQIGVTTFTAEAFLDALLTMGDSEDSLGLIMVHSVVKTRMQKNDLIDFIKDSAGNTIATFRGRAVIVDDGVPFSGNDYESWIFGQNAVQLGVGVDPVAVEVHREPLAGLGGGQEILTNRVIWSIHPTGHQMLLAAAGDGGPTNTDLAAAANWSRVYTERKQIKIARLITTEA